MSEKEQELLMALKHARELIDELRGYCDNWDWKWGSSWDIETAEIDTVMEKYSDRSTEDSSKG